MAVSHTYGPIHDQVRNVATGRIKIDTTAVAVGGFAIGFSPRYVCVLNASERVQLEWYNGLGGAGALKTIANGTRTKITTLGITTGATGFSVGLDTGLITDGGVATTDGEVLDYIAIG